MQAITVEAMESAIRDDVKPEFRTDYDRIVLAGMKVMFDPATSQIAMEQIQGDDKPEDIGRACVDLLMLLYQQSRGTMPQEAGIHAGAALCAHALEFAAKAGMGVTFDSDTYARTVKAYSAYLMKKLGFTPGNLEQLKQQAAAKQGQRPPAQAGV